MAKPPRLRCLPSRLKPAPTRLKPASAARPTSATTGAWLYGRQWRKARAVYLAEHPLCVACEREGRVTAATDVDHVIPHRGDERRFWDETNWQALCKTHHGRKTAAEDGGFANPVRG